MQNKKLIITLTVLSVMGSMSLALETKRSGTTNFSQVDRNGDGLISKAELTAYARTEAKAEFGTADINGDGALSLDELIAQRSAKGYPQLKTMINKVDTNSNGVLDFAEFQVMREANQERFGDRRQKIFDKFDTDNDNKLSKQEVSKIKKRAGKGKVREKVRANIRERVRSKIQSSNTGD